MKWTYFQRRVPKDSNFFDPSYCAQLHCNLRTPYLVSFALVSEALYLYFHMQS